MFSVMHLFYDVVFPVFFFRGRDRIRVGWSYCCAITALNWPCPHCFTGFISLAGDSITVHLHASWPIISLSGVQHIWHLNAFLVFGFYSSIPGCLALPINRMPQKCGFGCVKNNPMAISQSTANKESKSRRPCRQTPGRLLQLMTAIW